MSSPLHRPLLAWYRKNRRAMPWRESPSPYRTWVSEIMLQQTTVAAATPYFERFITRFPDPASLARASEVSVLRHWAGLGYYSRARCLRRAAAEIVSDHRGNVPSELAALLKLPGIGPYTAAAIASIAYGRPHELVDGNVARVLARLFAVESDPKSAGGSRRIWALARRHLHRGDPGTWNQALMELGALVCKPDSPACGSCPLKARCAAFAQGAQERLPVLSKTKAPVAVPMECLLIRRAGRVLLWKRADDERFLPGHWGFPEARHLPAARPAAKIGTVRHSITHHRITLTLRAAGLGARAPLPERAAWFRSGRLDARLVSSLWTKALSMVNHEGQSA